MSGIVLFVVFLIPAWLIVSGISILIGLSTDWLLGSLLCASGVAWILSISAYAIAEEKRQERLNKEKLNEEWRRWVKDNPRQQKGK